MINLILKTWEAPIYQQQEAVFWFIPLIIAAVAVRMVIATSDSTETERLRGQSLAILGMEQAGKTQLLRNLQGKEYSKYEQTSGSVGYEEFDFCVGERRIKIKKGEDIGGSEYNIKQYYEKSIKECDIVMFLFNIQKYKDDENYFKDTNARLDFIDRHITSAAHYAMIGTHLDTVKIREGEEIIKILQKKVEGKSYSRFFVKNFLPVNLTDKEDMEKIKDKLF